MAEPKLEILHIVIVKTLDNVFGNDQVKEDEMGRACITNRAEGECVQDIGGKARR
jgi:hypothetical protein